MKKHKLKVGNSHYVEDFSDDSLSVTVKKESACLFDNYIDATDAVTKIRKVLQDLKIEIV